MVSVDDGQKMKNISKLKVEVHLETNSNWLAAHNGKKVERAKKQSTIQIC